MEIQNLIFKCTTIVLAILFINFEKFSVHGQVISFGSCSAITPMRDFDISRYYGVWYEIEKYFFVPEVGASCVSVEYLNNGDTEKFGVKISMTQAGQQFVNPGSTVFNKRDGSADLSLDLLITQSPIPFPVRYPYYVLHTDYETYTIKWSCKQIGFLSQQNVWVLGRKRTFTPEQRDHIYTVLRSVGVRTQFLQKTDQTNCEI